MDSGRVPFLLDKLPEFILELPWLFAYEQCVKTVLVPQTSNRGRGRPQRPHCFRIARPFFHLVHQELGIFRCPLLILPSHDQPHHGGKGRETESLTGRKFLFRKGFKFLTDCRLDGRVTGGKSLYQDPATKISPAGSTGYLRDQLKGPFCCPEIREVEGGIRIDHADQ